MFKPEFIEYIRVDPTKILDKIYTWIFGIFITEREKESWRISVENSPNEVGLFGWKTSYFEFELENCRDKQVDSSCISGNSRKLRFDFDALGDAFTRRNRNFYEISRKKE